ncbi:MAG: VanW family protein [Chitinophagales bacterium]
MDSKRYSRKTSKDKLQFHFIDHRSVLVRRLGDSDPILQLNKITNLKIAAKKLNGILIRPGETFSFWRLVGKTSRTKGYLDGLCLLQGKAIPGTGGGLCQLSNLIYWMVLHTPLTVIERHRHSFDPFPDSDRVIPFGTGATVFYNYVDLQFYNPTSHTFQILISFDDTYIKGDILCDAPLTTTYRVFERNHRFIKKNGKSYRSNEIWREVFQDGVKLYEDILFTNFCEVKYRLDESLVTVITVEA